MDQITVFIAHSSADWWVASKIAEDLRALNKKTDDVYKNPQGVEGPIDTNKTSSKPKVDCVLYETHFPKNAPVVDSIRDQLKICQDFLIVITPYSIGSQWVFLELGGAMAMYKNVVPILIYIPENDIPEAVKSFDPLDINEFETYVNTLRKRLGEQEYAEPVEPSATEFKKRDKVRISVSPETELRPDIAWKKTMDRFRGKDAEITEADPKRRLTRLDIDEGMHAWGFEWLTPR